VFVFCIDATLPLSPLERILTDMHLYVRQTIPRVPNPVNPAEDFADKWYDPTCARPRP
jgi:hypothetical protein